MSTAEFDLIVNVVGDHDTRAFGTLRLRDSLEHTSDHPPVSATRAVNPEAQKMASLVTLAGGVVHDFSNLLTVICGNTNIVLDELPLDHPLRERLDDTLDAANRAVALLGQLSKFSRREDARRSPVALAPIVDDVVAQLRPMTPRVRFDVQCDASISVKGDAAQLRQLVVNVCTNAAQAIGDGEGTVSIRLESASGDPPRCRLRVSDDGRGMDRATMARIFDPFFTTGGMGRRGLGLAIAYGIIENHRGVATVESEPNKGTSFDVLLPRVDDGEPRVVLSPDVV